MQVHEPPFAPLSARRRIAIVLANPAQSSTTGWPVGFWWSDLTHPKALDANYLQAGSWQAFAIRDGNLITGQQNFSGAKTAELIIVALGR